MATWATTWRRQIKVGRLAAARRRRATPSTSSCVGRPVSTKLSPGRHLLCCRTPPMSATSKLPRSSTGRCEASSASARADRLSGAATSDDIGSCRCQETRTPTTRRSLGSPDRCCCIPARESSAGGRRVSSPKSTDARSSLCFRSPTMRPAACSRKYLRKRGANAGGSSSATEHRLPATPAAASCSSARSS